MNRREFLYRSLASGVVLPATGSLLDAGEPPTRERRGATGEALGQEDLEDILRGCTYLSCGGGGTLRDGMEIVRQDVGRGLDFRLLPVEEMEDEEYTATPYSLGSSAPLSDEMQRRYAGLPRIEELPAAASFRLLENYLGRKFAAVTVGELGPGSTAESLSIAAHLGIPSLDADAVGRATPEVDQYSLLAAGIPVVPAAAVSPFGDEIILGRAARPSREEQILRAIAVVSMNHLGVTDGAVPGRVVKRPGVLVTGSISHSRGIGQAFRRAREKGHDPIDAVLEAGQGYRLFEGGIEDFDWADEGGFLVGELLIAGTGRFRGSRYRIAFKNEHLIAWRDGEVSVLPPDPISLIATSTGEAIPNPEFERNQAVVAVGFRAPALWRTPKGLELFGPRHFSYDLDYSPIEARHTR